MQPALFSYDLLNDYWLIIDLPDGTKRKITDIKTSFDRDYRGVPVAGGQSFISLAAFSGYETGEPAVMEVLSKVTMGFMPFKIRLHNFGCAAGKEIYIAIKEPLPVEKLISELHAIEGYVKKARFNTLPGIFIAKNLLPFQFARSWKQYEKKPFSSTTVVNEILLLKRAEGFTGWQILKRFQLQNLFIAA